MADQVADKILIDSYCETGRSGGRSTPAPPEMAICDLYFEYSYVADQVADEVLIDSYCENSYLADQVADLSPPEMAIYDWYL